MCIRDRAYGGGTILGDPSDCGPGGNGNPNLPPLTGERVATMLTWAKGQIGKPYVFGANGPDAYDCSGFTRAAFGQIGITIPRTAGAQRDWLAAGNGYRVAAGQERPGDLIFWDSYLGPSQIGHVMIVWDPASKTTIEAQGTKTGIGQFSYASGPTHRIFELWRIGNLSDTPVSYTQLDVYKRQVLETAAARPRSGQVLRRRPAAVPWLRRDGR